MSRALLGSYRWLWLVALAGCASPAADADLRGVERTLGSRVESPLVWRRDDASEAEAERLLDALLASELDADSVAAIALLGHRGLQAAYEEIGVARADLAAARRPANPVLATSALVPEGGGRAMLDFGLTASLLDLLTLPARRSIAEHAVATAELDVAARALELTAEARRAYFAALGADQIASMRGLVVEAAGVSAELAHRMHAAGNLSDVGLARELAHYEDERLAWAAADAERAAAGEDLNRALGLYGARVAWTLPEQMPALPTDAEDLADVEARAIAGRLDLAAARSAADGLALELGVARDWRFLAESELGIAAERETDGRWLVGPEIVLELPLFDRGDAGLARRSALLRQADQRVLALAIDVRAEARAARERVRGARRRVEHYRDVVVPGREALVRRVQEEHAYMLVGAFELLDAKAAEYDAYQGYLEAVRDYWLARGDLDRALGGTARGPNAAPAGSAPRTPSGSEPHESHSDEHRH
jgi:cobalt-zinc-cadmium efflux system outer membrane protein